MTNTNKKIQEERIKHYFIEATKKILKGEGLKSVSVRNIAKEAGYSYATLYNYFKDVNVLVFECVKDFKSDLVEIVHNETFSSKRGVPKIKAIINSYIKFFVQYPGIFELFFMERVTDLGYKNPTLQLVYSILTDLCTEEWKYLADKNLFSQKEVKYKKDVLNNIVVGSLLFYLNRYTPSNYKDFSELMDRQINGILN
jgi:AcrR family transcriptional regulator